MTATEYSPHPSASTGTHTHAHPHNRIDWLILRTALVGDGQGDVALAWSIPFAPSR